MWKNTALLVTKLCLSNQNVPHASGTTKHGIRHPGPGIPGISGILVLDQVYFEYTLIASITFDQNIHKSLMKFISSYQNIISLIPNPFSAKFLK